MTLLSSACVRLALVGLVGFVLVQACSSADASGRFNGTGGFGGSVGAGGGGSSTVFNPDVTVPPVEGGMSGHNFLCGIDSANGCTPDDQRACSDLVPPNPQSLEVFALAGAGGDLGNAGGNNGGAAGSAGAAGNGGDGAASGVAGVSAGGTAGTDSTGAEGGAGGVPGPPAYACRVVQTRGASVSACAATGRGATNAPCFTGADCGAGLGCVADGTVSRCRPYCCSGESSCERGSYCAERELQDVSISTSSDRVWVPVCVTADNCELSEPYPCPPGRACQCSEQTACMVVRPDGTTACTAPGDGKLGDACPCAHGFVCSQGTQTATCVKLCATGEDGDAGLACPTGKCQASAELPAGWGVCVGG